MARSDSSLPWHRTKIICTLGPATDRHGVLEGMLQAGMDVARVNTAHGNPAQHASRIQQVRQVASQLGVPLAILVDLPGPKLRVGSLPDGALELRPTEEVLPTTSSILPRAIPVTELELVRAVRPGEPIYLADGSVTLRVNAVAADHVRCEVIVGGTIRSGSGLNLPLSDVPAVVPTEGDLRQLAVAVKEAAEWIGVSFVRTAEDLRRVRSHLPAERAPLVMAKIEKRQALSNLEAIVEEADGIMVARGDLGVETELSEIPLIQKRIIRLANEQARPVITATQMLESMVTHAQPTRAEVTDVANAVLDGTDGVMLSAETAIGRFPIEAVQILHRVITVTEAASPYRTALEQSVPRGVRLSEDAISLVACRLSFELGAKAIVVPVHSVQDALRVARHRPNTPILAMTDLPALCRQLAMVWGVMPLMASTIGETGSCVAQARQWLFEHHRASPGDPVVVLSTSSASRSCSDTLQIVHV